MFHVFLVLAFLIQGGTGAGRLFIESPWGKRVAWFFGGYESCLAIHKVVGILMICGFIVHLLYLLFFALDWKGFPRSLFGPDSLLPGPKDLQAFFRHTGWMLFITKPPRFDRWAYWEKFDYWAVFWGIPLLGVTGLLLAYPVAASRIMPGWGLNITLWIHRIEAILAMCHVFLIHFFIAHLRRRTFPMDRAMFEGTTDLDEARHEKPAWVERLVQDKGLGAVTAGPAPMGLRILYYAFGYTAMAAGLFLLIGGLLNSASITW